MSVITMNPPKAPAGKAAVQREVWERAGYRPDRPAPAHCDLSEVPMKTRGEIEAAICERISRLQQEYMGRGPKEIHAQLTGDRLVIRLQGVLTTPEQHLIESLSGEKGTGLVKQFRASLVELARPFMEARIQGITGVKVLSLQHDLCTVTGEEVLLFTLAAQPDYKQAKNR
jgi:uncharacterized protein YbcI